MGKLVPGDIDGPGVLDRDWFDITVIFDQTPSIAPIERQSESHEMAVPRLFLFLCICLLTSQGLAETALESAVQGVVRVNDGKTSGTAFLVSWANPQQEGREQTVLVTAAHAFEGFPAQECTLVLRKCSPDGEFTRLEWQCPIREGDQPLWKRHPDLDVAALPVTVPEEASVKPFRFEQIASEDSLKEGLVTVGDEVSIPGFPVHLESNAIGFPITRHGNIASYPLHPSHASRTIMIAAQTFGGDSGAPVVAIHNGEPLIVGLISGMHRQTDRSVTAFEERTTHMPLGLAIVVQAPYLRETVNMVIDPQ